MLCKLIWCQNSQVSNILQFNRQLEGLKGDGDLVPGVGRTSVWGGKYDSASGEGKSRDLRDLFKVYIEERLRRDGEITEVRCSHVQVLDEWVDRVCSTSRGITP